jgi:hypothetical protein
LQKTIWEPPPNELDLVFYLTRTAWPHLKASHDVVVNTASVNGLLSVKTPGSLAHTTAKAGIIMTRQLAIEEREHGLRPNSISPGLIETNETREQLKDPVWASAMLGSFSIGFSAAASGEMLDNKWRFRAVRRTGLRCLRSSMKASGQWAHHKGFVGIRRCSDGATAGTLFHRSRCWQARCSSTARAPSPSSSHFLTSTSAFSDGLSYDHERDSNSKGLPGR